MHWRTTRQQGAPHLARFFVCLFLAVYFAFQLTACSSVEVSSAPENPEKLITRGMDNFNRGRFHVALKLFKQVRDHYPFSNYSLLAELKSADSHYYMDEYSEAMALYEEFESKHPTNEAMPYVLFQMGMCYGKGIDTVDRDPGAAHDAIAVFTRLVRMYPKSPYVVEARVRIEAARDFLAKHELYVARFYMRTKKWEGAAARLDFILQQYPESSVVVEARSMLVEVRDRLQTEGGADRGSEADFIMSD